VIGANVALFRVETAQGSAQQPVMIAITSMSADGRLRRIERNSNELLLFLGLRCNLALMKVMSASKGERRDDRASTN
jgi:hypothetical protein